MSLLLPEAMSVHPETFHQKCSVLPYMFRMTFTPCQNFRSPKNPPGNLDHFRLHWDITGAPQREGAYEVTEEGVLARRE